MNKTLNEKLKLLDIENLMYAFFIIASLLNMDANEKTKQAYICKEDLNEDVKKQYILASYLILTVFIVFMERNYNNLNNLSPESKEYKFAQIRLYGSILIVLGQLLIIYYLYNTTSFKSQKQS